MAIKKFGDARDKMLAEGKKNILCTMPPRQREGKNYAGGRILRRRLKSLKQRQAMHEKSDNSHTQPGSMTK